jgi:hypothetical protein
MTKEDVLGKYRDELADYVERWRKAPLPEVEVRLLCPKLWSSVEYEELWDFLSEPLSSKRCISGLSDVCVYSFSFSQEKSILLLTNHLEELGSFPQAAMPLFISAILRDYPPGVYAYPSFCIRRTGEKWIPFSVAPDSFWHPRLGEADGNWFYKISPSELEDNDEIEVFDIK